jgi:exodeoxyribonuclease VII small subunit
MAKKPEAELAPGNDPVSRFEDAMKELEGIVQQLERGELRLEESLQLFQRGIELSRQCRGALDSAELKLHQLLEAPGADDAAS